MRGRWPGESYTLEVFLPFGIFLLYFTVELSLDSDLRVLCRCFSSCVVPFIFWELDQNLIPVFGKSPCACILVPACRIVNQFVFQRALQRPAGVAIYTPRTD